MAMAISGHKTESIYRRYEIVAHRDLAHAATRMEHYFGMIQQSVGTPKDNAATQEQESCSQSTANLLN